MLVIALGIMLVIIGFKGQQHALVAAITNKPAKKAT